MPNGEGKQLDALLVPLGLVDDNFRAGMQTAAQAMGRFASFVFSWRGLLTAGIATVIVGFTKVARAGVTAAAVLDTALREVATLLPQTSEQLDVLRDRLVKLSTQVPQAPEALTGAFYQIVSAGITETADAFEVLRASSEAAIGGLTDTETAADAITTVLNAFQLNAGEAARVSDVFFETVRQGKLRFGEVADVIGTVATSASLAGVSIEETGAALATLTKFGIDSAEASSSLNRFLLAVVKATDSQQAAAKRLGIEFNATALATKGLSGFMQDLADATGGNLELLAEIVPSIRAARSAFVLAGKGSEEFQRILREMATSAGAAREAFDEMQGTLDAQQALLKNKVNAAFRELGELILPAVVSVLRDLNRLLESDLEETIRLLRSLGEVALALRLERQQLAQQTTEEAGNLRQELRESVLDLRSVLGLTLRTGQPGGGGGVTLIRPFPEDFIDQVEKGIQQLSDASDRLEFATARDELEEMVAEFERFNRVTDEQAKFLGRFRLELEQIAQAEEIVVGQERIAGLLSDRTAEGRRRSLENMQALLKTLESAEVKDKAAIAALRLRIALENTLLAKQEAEKRLADAQALAGDDRLVTFEDFFAQLNRIAELQEVVRLRDDAESREDVARAERRLENLGDILKAQKDLNRAEEDLAKIRAGELPSDEVVISEPIDEEALEAALKRLAQIQARMEVLDDFGAVIFEDVPPGLRPSLELLIELNGRINQIKQDMLLTKDVTGELSRELDAVVRLRARILEQTLDIASTPESLLEQTTKRTLENMEELGRQRKIFTQLGLGQIAGAPPELLQLAQDYQALDDQVTTLDDDLDLLAEKEVEAATKALLLKDSNFILSQSYEELANRISGAIGIGERERLALIARQEEVARTAARLADVRDVITEFPTIDDDVLANLKPETLVGITEELNEIAEAHREIAEAEAEIEAAATIEDRIAATEKLRKATEKYEKLLQKIKGLLKLFDEGAITAAELVERLKEVLEGGDDAALSFADHLNQVAAATQGIIGLADAFGELDDNLRKALQGVGNLVQGLAQVASGNPFGLLQAAGGLAQTFAGILGKSPEDRARQQALIDNSVAISRLTQRFEEFAQSFARFTGLQIRGIRVLREALLKNLAAGAAEFPQGSEAELRRTSEILAQIFDDTLKEYGLTIEDFTSLMQSAGIDTDEFLETLTRLQRGFTLSEQEAQFFINAVNQFGLALEDLSLDELTKGFTAQADALNRSFDLFDEAFDEPIERLQAMTDLLLKFGGLSPRVQKILEGFNLNTPEGRRAAENFFLEIFKALTDPEGIPEDLLLEFGNLTRDQLLDFIGNFEGLIDEMNEAVEEGGETVSFQVSRTITETTGNRIVGALTTISIIEQLSLAVLREILVELGGTVPENVAAISFRAPGTELDILTVEQEQLFVLREIRDLMGGGGAVGGLLQAPTEETLQEFLNTFNPTPGLAEELALTPRVENNFGDILIEISDVVGELVPEEIGEAAINEIDRRLAQRYGNRSRVAGAPL
jgi:TP901 family phage tail tape measure protein